MACQCMCWLNLEHCLKPLLSQNLQAELFKPFHPLLFTILTSNLALEINSGFLNHDAISFDYEDNE